MNNLNLGTYYALDSPERAQHMNCVYAISGAYGQLNRLLYYVTLGFAIFGRRREWLIIGALVTAMTYAGTTAIHQITLVTSKEPVYDLDILGAWAVLSSGALAYIAMIHWSSSLRDTDARLIFLLWGLLLGVALIFGRTEIFSTPLADPEPACYSENGDRLLVYPIELAGSQFNCTYRCFSHPTIMRQASEVMAVPRSVLENYWTDLSVVLVGPIQAAAYAALAWDSMQHTPSRMCTLLVMKYLKPQNNERLVRFIHDASMERSYGGYFVLFSWTWHMRWSRLKVILVTLVIPWYILGLLIDLFALPLLVVNIVLNELSLMKPNLPVNEANYAIGQWGPIVAAAMVVIATIMNRYIIWSKRRKQSAKAAKEQKFSEDLDSIYEIQAELEEQSSGIVKPGLVHIPTLQDLGIRRDMGRGKGKQAETRL
jgi:hypothetical protein